MAISHSLKHLYHKKIDLSNNLCYPYSRMSTKLDIRSLCHPVARLGEAAQLALLTGEVYPFKNRRELIRSVRKGTIVEVVEGYLLATDIGRSDTRKRDWLATVDAIEDMGGVVMETSTQVRSDSPRAWRQVQAQAFEQIASSGRARRSAVNGAISKGAPKWTPTHEQAAVIDKEWFRRTNKTDNERMAVIQAKLGKNAPSRTTIRKYYGSPYATETK
jgi:hypothetical protein